jgi:hypothetical protein
MDLLSIVEDIRESHLFVNKNVVTAAILCG